MIRLRSAEICSYIATQSADLSADLTFADRTLSCLRMSESLTDLSTKSIVRPARSTASNAIAL